MNIEKLKELVEDTISDAVTYPEGDQADRVPRAHPLVKFPATATVDQITEALFWAKRYSLVDSKDGTRGFLLFGCRVKPEDIPVFCKGLSEAQCEVMENQSWFMPPTLGVNEIAQKKRTPNYRGM